VFRLDFVEDGMVRLLVEITREGMVFELIEEADLRSI
jgi:hypothetical protein